MKRISFFVFAGCILMAACNNSDSDSESSETDAMARTDTSSLSGGATGMDTSMNSTMPFMGAMNKMMKDMHSMQMTEDPDHDYAMMMKSHHQGAIEMSNIELSQGANAELKQVAQKIIDDSQKDIKDLDSFLNSHQADSKSDYAKRTMDKMMSGSSQMNMSQSGDIDQQFASIMAMHHRQGIDMSKDYLKDSKEAEVKKVANRVIKTNSADLTKLNKYKGTSTIDTSMSSHAGH